MADNEKWEDIVRKLMVKAEDGAATQDERDAYVTRVTYLMAKYSIDEAVLNSKGGEPETVTSMRIKILNPYYSQRMHLLDHIGRVFGCESIILEHPVRGGQKYGILHMFGYNGDLQRSYLLFGSLVIQMQTAMISAQSNKPASVHGRTFNNSFVTGYVDTVLVRVKAAYQQAKDEVRNTATGNGMELVLADRAVAVRNAFKTEYPRTVSVGYNPNARSSDGFSAGQSAGHRANIGQTGLAGGRVSIGS
jgi:Protein of unknown function (DUF2786)